MSWILRGQMIRFHGTSFFEPGLVCETDGAVVIDGAAVIDTGPADPILARYPAARVHRTDGVIAPGFIDAHVHYPQIGVVASWGSDLIDWLNRYTFPEEMRFSDPDYAQIAAVRFFDEQLRNGITCSASFCTTNPISVDAYFAEAELRGLRAIGGKVMMSRNAPEALLVGPEKSANDTQALIDRWHGKSRLTYAITPRFAPTSTAEELKLAGELAAQNTGCLVQSHLSEQLREIEWVKDLFPAARDYLDVYERAGLVRPGAVFGHAIHLTERERDVLAASGGSIAHCPTSNQFLGSGECDVSGLARHGIRVGLATDTGGGTSYSMLDTMKSAYEVAARRGAILGPDQLWWLATVGGAQALGQQDKIGNIAPGLEADLVVLDAAATPILAQRTVRAESANNLLFALMILGDDRAIRATYSGGRLVSGTEPVIDA